MQMLRYTNPIALNLKFVKVSRTSLLKNKSAGQIVKTMNAQIRLVPPVVNRFSLLTAPMSSAPATKI